MTTETSTGLPAADVEVVRALAARVAESLPGPSSRSGSGNGKRSTGSGPSARWR